MNMFLHEWKAYRNSTFIWTISIAIMMVVFLSIYPTFSKDSEQFIKILESYPKEVLKAVGADIATITSFLGYYSYIYMYAVLCLAIQAMNYGISIFSKEISGKTADFLLTKPVTRNEILTAKLLAVSLSLLMTVLVFVAITFLFAKVVTDATFDYKIFFLISASGFFVQLIFLSLGLLVSVVVPKIKSVLSISLSVVFGFFILSMFGSIIGEKAIRYLTPFKYFDLAYIQRESTYEFSYIWVGLTFIFVAVISSYIIFGKKNINA